jgi:hypothetical protein
MRDGVGIFGLVCGVVIIALVARYGYKTTDVELDAWITAFYFGMIATAGLGGHAVAARLWGLNRPVSVAVGIVSAVALMLNLGNSLGAIAGRQDKTTMDRVAKNRDIRTAEVELKRLEKLRQEMPAFVQTDAEVVAAAKRSADAATIAKDRECGNGDPKQRGHFCRDKETAEASAMTAWREASAAKAQTDRAIRLEADAQRERHKLKELGPIVTVNEQGSAIAKLFRLPDTEADFVSTAQQFGMAAIAELIIALCVLSWEILGRAAPTARLPDRLQRQADPTSSPPAPALIASATSNGQDAEGAPVERSEPPMPESASIDTVGRFMLACLARAPKAERVDGEAIYLRYRRYCEEQSFEPLGVAAFATEFVARCRKLRIDICPDGTKFYCVGVRLAA